MACPLISLLQAVPGARAPEACGAGPLLALHPLRWDALRALSYKLSLWLDSRTLVVQDTEATNVTRKGMLLRAAAAGHRLAEVHAILVCALHLGLRSFRAAALVAREVDQFRRSEVADNVSKHHCSRILQALSYVQEFPDCK